MNLYREENAQKNNGILSTTRPQDAILQTGIKTNNQLKTKLKQKSKIKIYVDGNRYYVEHSAAYAMGLIKTRAIMLDNPKLIEITGEVHNRLVADDTIEIQYIMVEKKQPLIVYVSGSEYCIDNGAAYAVKFITEEEFMNAESEYYYITQEMLNELAQDYKIEFHSLALDQTSSNKTL